MSYINFEQVTKRFGGTTALDSVSFSINEGECHAVMGENGAGKSTLGKILAGIHRLDGGSISVGGVKTKYQSARDARIAGIGMVHQELALCPDLSVAENLFLGNPPRRWGLFVDKNKMFAEANTLLQEIAPEIDVHRTMRSLSVAQRQLIQISSAIGTGANILIFDEPTSSLAETESQRLFSIIADLKRRGVTIIYVSHRMPEVFHLADRISVLRDGRFIGTMTGSEATEDSLVQMMIGRSLQSDTDRREEVDTGNTVLEIDSLSSPGLFQSVTLNVKAGEIVGVVGLVGAGRSELANAIFGLDPKSTGKIMISGKEISSLSVRKRMRAGLAYLPEDRSVQGLALDLNCRQNISITIPEKIRRWIFLNRTVESSIVNKFISILGIKTPSSENPVSNLSGGNQQKIVLAKWLAREAKVYILDEPTRGIDIGAKMSIHNIIRKTAADGAAILLISSELPEILSLSNRIYVMRNGALVGETKGSTATQGSLLRMMSGL